ncbi:Retrovirus-related Pol polyprotein from transposon RE2, partial [Bienertia sinuspersici]
MPSKNGNPTLSDMLSPLYLHPYDGPHTGTIQEKLDGPSNYRAWRRDMEIVLASKDPKDAEKQDQWDTCNSMVIAWMIGSMTSHVKESVMYVRNARDMWMQLERRFSLTNGTRKYKLNKVVYDLRQKEQSVTEYYTTMKSLWDELDAMSNLPPITVMTLEVQTFVNARNKQRDEERLFQFLNGFDDDYGSERSHILMFSPLPSVEEACARFVQEEAQREILKEDKAEIETGAMMGKKIEECAVCGLKGHTKEKCWKVIGYPRWHLKHKRMQKGESTGTGAKWNRGRQAEGGAKWAANAQSEEKIDITAKKLEKLMKVAPTANLSEEGETSFACMVFCCNVNTIEHKWIMNTGTTDHMTANPHILFEKEPVKGKTKINLPTGKSTCITCKGKVKLENGLVIKDVLLVPEFKHNLLSISKLLREENCKVVFHSKFCLIQDYASLITKAVGKLKDGLYVLMTEDQKMKDVNKGKVGSANVRENQERQEGETTSDARTESYEKKQSDTVEEVQCDPKNVSSKEQLTSGPVEENTTAALRRSSRETKTPAWFSDYKLESRKRRDNIPTPAANL